MLTNTCKKMKNFFLKRRIKTSMDDMLPARYKTKNDSVYKLNLKEIYRIIEEYSYNPNNKFRPEKYGDSIYVHLSSIRILSSNANKVRRLYPKFTQQVIAETLKKLFLKLKGKSLHEIETSS